MTLLVLLFILTLVIFKYFKDSEISTTTFLMAWGVKIIYSLFFYWITMYYYGNGHLYGDAGMFISNAKFINEIAYHYPMEYIKLLFGQADFYNPDLDPFLEPTRVYLGGDKQYDYLNDNRLIIKLNSIIYFISNGNVLIHLLVHTFISYFGLLLIFKSLKKHIQNKKWFWWGLVVLPSVGFWSGGITKSSILILSIGLFFYAFKLFNQNSFIKGFILFLLSSFLLIFNKTYVGLIVISLSSIYLIAKTIQYKTKYIWITALSIIVTFIVLVFNILPLHFTKKISVRQQDMINIGKGGVYFVNDTATCFSDYKYANHFKRENDTLVKVTKDVPCNYKLFGTKKYYPFNLKASSKLYPLYLFFPPSKSYYDITPINNSPTLLLKSIPQTIFDVLIRPLPWDNGRNIKIFSFVQNILLFAFLILSIFNRNQSLTPQQKWIIFYLVTCSIFLSIIIGLTTPVFGAMVRYKMPIDLFLLIISFIILKPIKHETN